MFSGNNCHSSIKFTTNAYGCLNGIKTDSLSTMTYKIPTPIYEKKVVDSSQRGYVYELRFTFMIYTHGGLYEYAEWY